MYINLVQSNIEKRMREPGKS